MIRSFALMAGAAAIAVAPVTAQAAPSRDAAPVTAVPPDAAPVARRAHDKKRPPRSQPSETGTGTGRGTGPGEETGTGTYSVDSNPYATIYIDGKSYGDTPVFKAPLPAGKHDVRAVRADGVTKTFSIVIRSGKLTSSGKLAW